MLQFRECQDPACRLRFPMSAGDRLGDRCPRCRGRTDLVHTLAVVPEQTPAPFPPLPCAVLVDNVRSLFNVGSIFRSADGAGFAHLYLCGISPTPDNRKLAKTALGAELSVPWSYHANSVVLAAELRSQGHILWALEAGRDATSIFDIRPPAAPLVLVVGNERAGVDPDLLARCAATVAIPMRGAKQSLNVATAFGIAAAVLAEAVAWGR
jgi:23S rRNA (guanosine2251-2'-O)-methyltransferase